MMAWVRQYSVPNVVRDRTLKALIFYMINPLLVRKRPLCVLSPLIDGLGTTYAVHLRLLAKPVVDFLLVIIELFSLGVTADEFHRISIGNRRFRRGWVTLAQNFR